MFVTAVVAVLVLLWPDLARWRRRHSSHRSDEQQLLAAIHAELAAGASLRHAIAAVGDHTESTDVRRLALAGAPMKTVVAALEAGPRVAAAIDVAARSGGRAAAVFQRLADRAAADVDLAREQRTLTTQARLSAAIVAGMPILWLLFGAGAGIVAVVGLVMEALGVVVVWRLASS
jgi:Flp pilus assembly protein TadB